MAEYMCPKMLLQKQRKKKKKKKHLGKENIPNANFLEWGGMWWFRPPPPK